MVVQEIVIRPIPPIRPAQRFALFGRNNHALWKALPAGLCACDRLGIGTVRVRLRGLAESNAAADRDQCQQPTETTCPTAKNRKVMHRLSKYAEFQDPKSIWPGRPS